MSIAPQNATILGTVFEFQPSDEQFAIMRAWQIWMERLDPLEIRGSALYEGVLHYADGTMVIALVASGSTATIRYICEAFSSPDVATFPGLLPLELRFIAETLLPREQLTLIGYVTQAGIFQMEIDRPYLQDIAAIAGWNIPLAETPQQKTLAIAKKSSIKVDVSVEMTKHLQTVQLDGATQYMLRLWKSSYRHSAHQQNRRHAKVMILVGLSAVLLTIGMYIFVAISQHKPTNAASPFTITGLPVRVLCDSSKPSQFTITNATANSLVWSTNGGALPSEILMNPQQGIIPPHESQIVRLSSMPIDINAFGTQIPQVAQHYSLQMITLTQTAPIDIIYGGCPAR